MTLNDAKAQAQAESNKHQLVLAVVKEGIHADELAELDSEGNSYGYCPKEAVSLLYPYGEVVEFIHPKRGNGKSP